ncbi:SR-related and CTD-associated factor 8 [Halotydeus destructor]|nr:SR-related and CTD-associated factor 8 [Halotydeus destructor]
MEVVQAFHGELSSLSEMKPPISKAKMNQITKSAIKGIKMYKHVVLDVERFISKCRPEYKLPGLYVVDSIVRQSRHQFGPERDVFGPRFTRNFQQTFQGLFKGCPPDDKPKIVRVLNLWQRNNVFSTEIIQPLLDMAHPNSALKQGSPNSNTMLDQVKSDDPNLMMQLIASLAQKNNSGDNTGSQIKFNKKLLDFDYGEDDDDEKGETPTEAEPPTRRAGKDDTDPLALTFAQNLLSNPELLQLMQHNMQQQQATNPQSSIASQGITATVPSFNAAPETHRMSLDARLDAQNNLPYSQFRESGGDSSRNEKSQFDGSQLYVDKREATGSERRERRRSRSRSPRKSRFSRNERESDSRRRSRSRSPNWRSSTERRSHRSPARQERQVSPEATEREKERERRKRGLPPIRKGCLTVCSTTLWLGHVPKLVSEADISNSFGEYGTINSIDLIPPRGCAYVAMDRRQDAHNALSRSKSLKLAGNSIKVAWAPGKGTKAREFKDFWDVELGASYIPYDRIHENIDLDSLEEGGMFDEDSMPAHLSEHRQKITKEREEAKRATEVYEQPPPPTLPPVSYPPLGLPMPPLLAGQGIDASFLSKAAAALAASNMSDQPPPLNLPPLPPFPTPPLNMPMSLPPHPGTPNTPSNINGPLSGQPFSAPPLNIPPPSVLSGQRPPPLSAWGNPPPPVLTGPNATPLPFRPPLAPFPAPSLPPAIDNGQNFPPGPNKDDPFAPSAYELKAMNTRFLPPPPPPGFDHDRDRFFDHRGGGGGGRHGMRGGMDERPNDWGRRDNWRDRERGRNQGDRNSRFPPNHRDRRDRGGRRGGRRDDHRGDGQDRFHSGDGRSEWGSHSANNNDERDPAYFPGMKLEEEEQLYTNNGHLHAEGNHHHNPQSSSIQSVPPLSEHFVPSASPVVVKMEMSGDDGPPNQVTGGTEMS